MRSNYIIHLKENTLRFVQTFNQFIISKNFVEIQDCAKLTKCLYLLYEYFQTIIGTPHITCLLWSKYETYTKSSYNYHCSLWLVIDEAVKHSKINVYLFLYSEAKLVWIRHTNLNWRHCLLESSFNITIRFYLNDSLKSNPKHKRIMTALIKKTPWTRTETCTHYICELTIKWRHNSFAMPIDLS